jgi:DNA-binding IclR family transcriptional regulator
LQITEETYSLLPAEQQELLTDVAVPCCHAVTVIVSLQISEETYSLLPAEQQAAFELREAVPVKGKGTLRTYLLKQEQQQEQEQ